MIIKLKIFFKLIIFRLIDKILMNIKIQMNLNNKT